MKTPFSVMLCVYAGDDPVWFRAAFDSIWNQTVRPSEIVLTVDGPVPETLAREIRRCEENPACRVVRLEKNVGHGRARAAALARCRFPLVALMDADDLSLPDRFEKQLEAFAYEPELSAVGGQIGEFTRSPGEILGRRLVREEHDGILQDMKKRCPMNQVTVMLKKEPVLAAGGYRDWYCNEDYDLWIRMALSGCRFRNLPDTLVLVRTGENMYRRRGGWRYFSSEAALQIALRRNGIIGPVRCLWNLALRFAVQLLMPGKLRGRIFRKFARKAEKHGK